MTPLLQLGVYGFKTKSCKFGQWKCIIFSMSSYLIERLVTQKYKIKANNTRFSQNRNREIRKSQNREVTNLSRKVSCKKVSIQSNIFFLKIKTACQPTGASKFTFS